MWTGIQVIIDKKMRALYMAREPVHDMGFVQVFTPPEYVRDIDSYFCARIKNLGQSIPLSTRETLKYLIPEYHWPKHDSTDLIRQDILQDRYLCDELKQDLLHNLDLYSNE